MNISRTAIEDYNATLATFGPTVDADWAGQFPYIAKLETPSDPIDITTPALVVSQKMVVASSELFHSNSPASYTMTDHNLEVHQVARLVWIDDKFVVVKTCKPFGSGRFNLTLSEFFDYQADDPDAAIIFFQADSLKSKSTTVLSDATCDSTFGSGYSGFNTCIAQDTTANICATYYTDSLIVPTFVHKLLLVVQGRVQATLRNASCDASNSNFRQTQFRKIDKFRTNILRIAGIVVDNP
ncbi:uncharacterized protein LOC132195675 isoform X2 [Neocloeon triangulifer]|uniref:uncharacterized protein LOC132195675 isoform X2 n=1 Tax=Neocloeon triangulifer TaxID=2078957 RepID=UPI00286F1B55|nr:uncharacterized protein LOC132195675 isoform X2 [Neocloeon triangulifer]